VTTALRPTERKLSEALADLELVADPRVSRIHLSWNNLSWNNTGPAFRKLSTSCSSSTEKLWPMSSGVP
jgi:hypothetical protein